MDAQLSAKSRLVSRQMIELKHLRFAAVAHGCGSFRKAADFLSVQHTALSRSVAQLEVQVGATLFERSATGVRATVAGLHFLNHAIDILEQIDVLLKSTSSIARRQSGHLSVGLCTSVAAARVGELLAKFRRRCALAKPVATERPPKGLRRSLQGGSLDVIVVPARPKSVAVQARALWHERVLVLLPTNHALASHKTVSWKDLGDHTILLVTPDRAGSLDELIESKLVKRGIARNVQRHDVSRRLIHRFTSMGLGVSFILESDIATAGSDVVYRELHEEKGQMNVCFYAHWLPNNRNPALHLFLTFLAERYPSPAER